MSFKLQRCPACKGAADIKDHGSRGFVRCLARDCGLSGPFARTVEEAVAKWNRLSFFHPPRPMPDADLSEGKTWA